MRQTQDENRQEGNRGTMHAKREPESEPSATEADDPSGDSAPRQLSKDVIFKTLSNSRRRRVLRYLQQHGREEAVPLRDLSEWIAALENEVELVEVTYKQRKRVHTALYQTHLPKLAGDGIVDYDRRAGTVALSTTAATLEPYLDTGMVGSTFSWRSYWLGFGTVALALGFAAAIELAPGELDGGTLSLALGVATFGSAVAFVALTR